MTAAGLPEQTRSDRSRLIPAVPRDVPAPVSFAQERFLFLDRLQGPSATFNLASRFHLRGTLDVAALQGAIGDLVQRHEVLRTVFDTTSPIPTQRAGGYAPSLVLIDLAAFPDARRAAVTDEIARSELDRPFDIRNGPHLRCRLLRWSAHEHHLLVVLHHIVSDGESIPILLRELAQRYAARTAGRAPLLEPLALQYRDIASWQRSAAGESFEEQLEFWKVQLEDLPVLLRLPHDHPRPAPSAARTTTRGASVSFPLPHDSAPLAAWAPGAARATGYHRLLAAFAILLNRYTGESELVIGSPTANRAVPETQQLIGPLLNVLPIRLRLADLSTTQEVVEAARRAAIDALAHGDVPFEQIVHAVGRARDAGYAPLFQVMFAYESTPVEALRLPGLEVETHFVEDATAKYDLTLVVHKRDGRLQATFKYDRDLFERATIERFAAHYAQIVASIGQSPQQPFRRLPVGPPAEQARLAGFARGAVRPYPVHRLLHAFFEDQAERVPHAVALDFEGRTLEYAELNRRANRLAHALIRLGIGPEAGVAICLERSHEMVIAMLAVLKAGGAYVPIDTEYPAARRASMMRNVCARVLITHERLASSLEAEHVIALDEACSAFASESDENPVHRARPRNACYIIHTSGTTGDPKAVLTEHEAICNNLLWMQDQWPLDARDVVLLKSSFSFDVSLKEIMWPLMAGARLRIAKPGGHRDPQYVHEVVRQAGVTVVHLVPSMLDYFLQHGSAEQSSLRMVMCGGEALSFELKNRFCARHAATLLHLYGPTEAAIAVTASTFGRANPHETVSLGRPMANASLHILDADGEPVPVGVRGELYIGGTPLARGYMNSAPLTAARFVPDPFGTTPGARLYRTGDLARWRGDGAIEYLGRRDRQIKLRGLRMEPDEIEAAVRAHEGIRHAAVAMRKLSSGAPCLVGYLVPENGANLDLDALRRSLRERLPVFMVPERWVMLDALPVGPNGKADVDALPDPPPARSEPAATLCADPDLEARVERAWCDVLGRESVGHSENFFDAGGHSFAVARLQRSVQELCGRELPLTDFFAHPTIASLARHLEGVTASSVPTPQAVRPAADVRPDAIAVVGMAARLPGARDVGEFWNNLLRGVESIRFFDEAELRADGVPEAVLQDPKYVRARGVITDVDQFDARFFGFSAREADVLDPQLRLLLELSQLACDDAGYEPRSWRLRKKRCAVFASASRSTYFLNVLQQRPDVLMQLGPQAIALATDKSFLATQIAYRLDLVGPSVTIDTACSSSLVALHHACQSIRNGDADAALVGGASVDTPMIAGYFWQQGNIASPDGHCRPFDAEARGTVKGSGAVVVVLKRLADALADGDTIRAVITGTAINNDGARKVSFTAPSEAGEVAVISAALESAGVEPGSIGYVETHGTGTVLGDPIEAAALERVFDGTEIFIGSVKANIGHLDAAAGLSGFLKVVLALSHDVIPPAINFTRSNLAAKINAGPLRITTSPRSWPDGRRRAGVSSFGIGGTNAHVIVEAAPAEPIADEPRDEVILLSAATPAALARTAQYLESRWSSVGSGSLAGISLTCATRAHDGGARRALVVSTHEALREELSVLARETGNDSARVQAGRAPRVGLLLPEAAPDAQLIDSLRQRCPVFDRAFAECADAAPASARGRSFALTYALIRSLLERGIEPALSVTAPLAELALACARGTVSVANALASATNGTMDDRVAAEAITSLCAQSDLILAVCSAQTLRSLLAPLELPSSCEAIPLWTDAVDESSAPSSSYLKALARVWERGIALAWPEFADRTRYRRASAPPTPFERRRHWIDANPHAAMMWTGPVRVPAANAAPTVLNAAQESVRTEAERVHAAWCDLLGLEQASTHEDSQFFASGGNSLLATQLMRAIEEATGRRVSLPDFFEQPTLGALIALTRAGGRSEASNAGETEREALLL